VQARARHYHRFAPAPDLVPSMGAIVLDHYLCLLSKVVGVQAGILSKGAFRLGLVDFRIVRHRLFEPVIGRIGHIVFQDIENELLLDSLTHGVEMEGARQPVRAHGPEKFHGLFLWRRSEGEETDVRLATFRADRLQDLIFGVLIIIRFFSLSGFQ